jgi:hypothetical protein
MYCDFVQEFKEKNQGAIGGGERGRCRMARCRDSDTDKADLAGVCRAEEATVFHREPYEVARSYEKCEWLSKRANI